MKILYIAGLYRKRSCSASIRNVALANGLQSTNCDVTVLTVKFPNEVLDPYLISSVDNTIRLVEIDAGYLSSFIPSIYKNEVTKQTNKPSRLKTFIKNIIYFPGLDKMWLPNINPDDFKEYDLIISSSDTKTSHFAAKRIIKAYPIEWLQIWGDPWADDIGLTNKLLKLRASFSERKLLNDADHIGYVSLPTANKISHLYPTMVDKINFIPRNFFKSVKETCVAGKTFNIAYTGVLKGRDINPIIESIKLYNEKHDTKIILDIYGRISEEQKDLISNSECVTYHGEVSLQSVYKVFESSHALLYLGNSAGSSQIPGKLYDYFGTKLPILALVQDMDDEVSEFILNSNRCIVFENNKDTISLEELVDRKGSFDVLEQYSPESVALTIMKIINKE